jgi:uncharacterized membrane protein YagU involved in acid resistance
MNILSVILWGFASTVVLTIIMGLSKPLGLSRMDIPFLLGTMFTPNRNKAPFIGLLSHIIIGWIFAFIYAAAFETSGIKTWWFGLLIGLVHGAFVLTAGLQTLSAFHPRMAQPHEGPGSTKQLQPPGFFALNYGKGTPMVTLFAHLIYGCMLGTFYQ